MGTIDVVTGSDLAVDTTLQAGDAIHLSSTSGNVTISGAVQGYNADQLNDFTVDASGSLDLQVDVNAVDLIEIDAGTTISERNLITTGADSTVDITMGLGGSIAAQGLIKVETTGGSLTFSGGISGNAGGSVDEVQLIANNDVILNAQIDANSLIDIDSGGSLSGTELSLSASAADGEISISVNDSLDVATSMTADQKIELVSASGDITLQNGSTLSGNSGASGEIILNASGDLNLNSQLNAIDLIDLTAGGALNTAGDNAAMTANGATGEINIDTGSDLSISNALIANDTITLTSGGDLNIQNGSSLGGVADTVTREVRACSR